MTAILPIVENLPPDSGYDIIPRITIDHNESAIMFNDEPVAKRNMDQSILLGIARQRNMFQWGAKEGGRNYLECESRDYEHGTPTEDFPWEDSNFDPMKYSPDVLGDAPVQLDCGSCAFSNWTATPYGSGKSSPPRCVEQVAALILIPQDVINPSLVPLSSSVSIKYRLGSMIFKKSALKPINDYIQTLRLEKRAPYEFTTSITLKQNLGRGFSYSVPSLERGLEVESSAFTLLSRLLREGRAYLSKPTPKVAPKKASFFGVESSDDIGPRYTGTFF